MAIVRLERFYGKIDKESFEFRRKHDTQGFTFVTAQSSGDPLEVGDIIGFAIGEQTKLSPGSKPVTHGSSEGVKEP